MELGSEKAGAPCLCFSGKQQGAQESVEAREVMSELSQSGPHFCHNHACSQPLSEALVQGPAAGH